MGETALSSFLCSSALGEAFSLRKKRPLVKADPTFLQRDSERFDTFIPKAKVFPSA